MKFCISCAEELEDEAKFCFKCGAKQAKEPEKLRCINCGAELSAGTKFCSECGANQAAKPAEEPEKPRCVKCGAELPADSKFCNKCGANQATKPEKPVSSGKKSSENAVPKSRLPPKTTGRKEPKVAAVKPRGILNLTSQQSNKIWHGMFWEDS
jgi:ribosomal protein L40E